MTTIFRVRVEAVDGPHLTLHVDHTYGWDWASHLVTSRTLALHFLWEPLLRYVGAVRRYSSGRRVPEARAQRLAEASPLWHELGGRDSTDEAWNRANVGRFISCVGAVNRRHHTEMWNDTNDLRWSYPRHVDRSEVETATATYTIATTDPCWLAHLAPRMEWHSTAYNHDEKVVVNPAWRTSTVLGLARHVDDSGDFSALPILADALQEAGCTDERLLGHCRGPGPHARGCWAVDLLLGSRLDPRAFDSASISRVDVEFWPLDHDPEETPPPPGASSAVPEDIAAVLAPIRSAQEFVDTQEWARGEIRFAHRGAEPTELLFFPGRDPKRYELRAAGRVYGVDRAAFVGALRRIGVELPTE